MCQSGQQQFAFTLVSKPQDFVTIFCQGSQYDTPVSKVHHITMTAEKEKSSVSCKKPLQALLAEVSLTDF